MSAAVMKKRALMAIRIAGASGDLTDTDHVLWLRTRGTPYVPSPLLYDESLYYSDALSERHDADRSQNRKR